MIAPDDAIDDIRSHILVSWIAAGVLCYGIFAIAGAVHYKGVTFADLALPARHLFAVVGPTLGALTGLYFSGNTKTLALTAGQRRVLLVLSYVYLVSFILVSAGQFATGFGLDQEATSEHQAIDHYVLLTYVQPLVAAPLCFLFGRSAPKVD
jgi:hypothetical protein